MKKTSQRLERDSEAAIAGVLRNFAEFTGKTSDRISLLIKTLAQVFSCEFCEYSQNRYFTEHLLKAAFDR